MSLWIKDPGTGKASVSLSLLILSTILLIIGIALDYSRGIKSSELLSEFFLTSVSLYFGRRVKWGPQGSSVGEKDEEAKE